MVSVHPNRRDETLLVVTSREKTGEGDATNTHFAVHLNNNSKTNGITAAHLNHVTVPNMFNNVRDGLNNINVTLKSTIGPDITHKLTIPAKYYATLDELHTAVNTAATAAGLPLTLSNQGSDHTFWNFTGVETPPMHIVDLKRVAEMGVVDPGDPMSTVENGTNDSQGNLITDWCQQLFHTKKAVQFKTYSVISFGDDEETIADGREHAITIRNLRYRLAEYPPGSPGLSDPTSWPNLSDLYERNVVTTQNGLSDNQRCLVTVKEVSRKGNVATCNIISIAGHGELPSGALELPGGGSHGDPFAYNEYWLLDDNTGSVYGAATDAADIWKDVQWKGGEYWKGINNDTIVSSFPYYDVADRGQLQADGLRIWDERATYGANALDPLFWRYWVFGTPDFRASDNLWYDVHLSSPTAGQEGDLLTHVLGITDGVGPGLTDPNTGAAFGISSAPGNLNGPQAVLLMSTMLAEGNAIGVGDGSGTKLEHPVIDMIPMMNVPRGGFAWYQPSEVVANLLRYKHRKQLSRVDFKITDTNGRALSLPHNYHVTVVMRLIHESLDGV